MEMKKYASILLMVALCSCSHSEIWKSNVYYSHTDSPPRQRLEHRLNVLYDNSCRISDGTETRFSINGQHITLQVPNIGKGKCQTAIPYAICEAAPGEDPTDLCKRVH